MPKSLLAAMAIAILAPTGASIALAGAPAHAQDTALPGGEFVRKQKRLEGSWQVEQRGDQAVIVFAEDFRAAGGPDLKVFLSPTRLSDVTGKTAVNGSVLLGELVSTRGAQEYVLPAGVELHDFASVLVHCEAYSVIWGGGDVPR